MSKHYTSIGANVTMKTAFVIDRLAEEYGVSRTKMVSTLLEWAAEHHGESIEVAAQPFGVEGYKDKKTGTPKITNYRLRKTL